MKVKVQFSLRTMLIAIIGLGSLLSIVAVQLKWIYDRHQALQWISPLNERQLAAQRGVAPPPRKGIVVAPGRAKPPWPLRFFGEMGIERIEINRDDIESSTPNRLTDFQRLFPEAEVIVVR